MLTEKESNDLAGLIIMGASPKPIFDDIWKKSQKEILKEVVTESESWDRERLIEVINKKLWELDN